MSGAGVGPRSMRRLRAPIPSSAVRDRAHRPAAGRQGGPRGNGSILASARAAGKDAIRTPGPGSRSRPDLLHVHRGIMKCFWLTYQNFQYC